ncbi:uncharacterized protein LOC133878775 [Alnus glutinosa]|uniref:uncharacterized protein LOC133878775 n=1 Tax=Alnus glutinosa TaxID=3517 RepID=UPI002D7A3177|nr:uncharacterized protein LOC133878775 [Alnus glutinosa]
MPCLSLKWLMIVFVVLEPNRQEIIYSNYPYSIISLYKFPNCAVQNYKCPDWVADGLRGSICSGILCLLIGVLLVITESVDTSMVPPLDLFVNQSLVETQGNPQLPTTPLDKECESMESINSNNEATKKNTHEVLKPTAVHSTSPNKIVFI